jgi:hypothetical protein
MGVTITCDSHTDLYLLLFFCFYHVPIFTLTEQVSLCLSLGLLGDTLHRRSSEMRPCSFPFSPRPTEATFCLLLSLGLPAQNTGAHVLQRQPLIEPPSPKYRPGWQSPRSVSIDPLLSRNVHTACDREKKKRLI